MNKGLQDISDEDLWRISLNSITNEKIRVVEILNHIEEIKVEEENLNIVMESIYKKKGFNNLDDFKNFLKANQVDYDFLIKKLKSNFWMSLYMKNSMIKLYW